MFRVASGKEADFFSLPGTLARRGVDEFFDLKFSLLVGDESFDNRVLGSEDDTGGPVDGIDACSEHPDRFWRVFEREIDFGAFGPSDPVALHGQNPLRPSAFELLHIIQQLGRVGGRFEKPLLHGALFDGRRFMPPAAAVHHLFVGKHGSAFRAPVEQRFLAIGQAALVHLEKEPLVPAIIVGLAARNLAVPVKGEAQPLHLRLHERDVGERPVARITAFFERRVFGRKSERIPAHGMQHVVAAHPHIAGECVADGIVAHVSHVQLAARVGQHLEHIVFGLVRSIGGIESGVIHPPLVPFRLNFLGVVRFFGDTSSFSATTLRRSSPGLSTGVSRMNAFSRSLGWFKMRRKPSKPI